MIDPVAVSIGPFQVHWYGIIIAAAVLIAATIATFEARRRREDPEHAWSMLLIVLVAGILGARLYHVVHEWSFYSENPALIPQIWRGGLGIPGAIAGGALAIWLYTRFNKLSTPRWMDIAAPGLLLAQAIGRLGNFVNQELYGPPTNLPWGIPISPERQLLYPDAPLDARFHPLFAYEGILNVIGMVVLLTVGRRFASRLYDGDITLLYLVWYGSVRTALETFRVQNWYIGPLPTAMWLGLLAVVLAGGFLILRHVKGWGTPGAWMHREDDDDTEAETSTPARAAEPQPG